MANANNPNGLIPIRHMNGSPYTGQFNEYTHLANDSAVIGIGSPVKFTGIAAANEDGKILPVCALGTAADVLCGVCVGVKPITNASTPYTVASTLRTVYVADSPDLIFEIQEDSAGGDIALASVGLNANLTTDVVSTVTGRSNCMLDSSDVATDTTGTVKILRPVQRPDNAIPPSDYCRWEVTIAEHQYMQATANIGTDI